VHRHSYCEGAMLKLHRENSSLKIQSLLIILQCTQFYYHLLCT